MDFTVWIVLITIATGISLITVLTVCVCCRRKTPKNDWHGVDGMVTINNPDENVNHIPAASPEPSVKTSSPVSDTPKRLATSNTRRSLPDIPSDGGPVGAGDVPAWDNNSELYATVEDKASAQPNSYPNFAQKRHTLPNGLDRPSLSQHSSISQADDSIYAKVKENPYDKVKKPEHPYAKVQSADSKEQDESSGEATPRASLSWGEGTSHMATREPSTSPHSRPPSVQGSSGSDIPAATAVAGRVAASQELPYMTPPVTQPLHFSGDSQDSSKGYTSISVREPLANIRAQTKDFASKQKRREDPHYATVSDDSDEMYTTIEEPNNTIYTSGSETYAQIQPLTVTVEVNPLPSSSQNVIDDVSDELYEPPPPPSVHSLIKNVTHSRQASSSSCNSSVANVGSPKPEKRQANSPLPPPPSVSPDMYSKVEKKRDREAAAAVAKNLEAMYAKVQKNKRKELPSDDLSSPNTSSSITLPVVLTDNVNAANMDNVSRKSWSMSNSNNNSNSSHQQQRNSLTDSTTSQIVSGSSKSLSSDFNVSSSSPSSNSDHCYETLNKNKSPQRRKVSETTDPGYEKVQSADERRRRKSSVKSSGTGSDDLTDCATNVDPGYEVLNHNKPPSDCDPNYEVLRPSRTSSCSDSAGYSTIGNGQIKPNFVIEGPSPSSVTDVQLPVPSSPNSMDGYSVVNKRKKKPDPGYEELQHSRTSSSYESEPRSLDEPNYESMPSESASDHNYAQLKSNGSESDPNYETVSQGGGGDPNYESVKYLADVGHAAKADPPYERLHNEDSSGKSDATDTNTANSSNGVGGGGSAPPAEETGAQPATTLLSVIDVRENNRPAKDLSSIVVNDLEIVGGSSSLSASCVTGKRRKANAKECDSDDDAYFQV